MPSKHHKKSPKQRAPKPLKEITQNATVVSAPARVRSAEEIAQLKVLFLQHFSDLGRVDLSCKLSGIIYAQPYAWAKVDEDFKKSWEEARKVAAGRLEDAAMRRAVDGIKKPLYQRGELVGFVKEYSDPLTMFLLRGLRPEVYRDNATLEVGNKPGETIKVQHGLSDEAANEIRMKILGVEPK